MATYDFATNKWVDSPPQPQVKVATPTVQPTVRVATSQLQPKLATNRLSFWRYADDPTVHDQSGKAYDLKSFKAAGGTFDKVQVRQRVKAIQSQPQGQITKITGAVPPQRQYKQSTVDKLDNSVFSNAIQAPIRAGQSFLQSGFRTTGAAVNTIANSKLGQRLGLGNGSSQVYDPNATGTRKILQEGIYDSNPGTSETQGKDTLSIFGKRASSNPKINTAVGLGLAGLDFLGSGEEKNAIKALAETKDIGVISKILKNIGVTDDIVKEYAPVLATTSKADDVTKIISHIDELQKTTKTVGLKERGFVTSVKETIPEAQINSRYNPRNTENLAIKARNLVKEDIETAEKVASGVDDKAVATTTELIKHYKNLADTAKTTAEKNLALDKIAVIANDTAKNLTQAGRTVQAASILNMQTPEGNLRFASRLIQKYNENIDKQAFRLTKKIPELTPQQANEILNESKAVFSMPEGEAKAIAYQKLQEKINGLIPSSAYKKIISVWKAGLLTGLKTTGVNLSANISHGISETAKDIPAAIVDKITSLVTGKRTLALTSRGSGTGVAEGFSKGLRYMRTGYDERNIAAKLDYNKVNFTSTIGKGLQKYEEAVFHLLGAEDQPFYYGAKARSLYSQAIAEAKNQGLKGLERSKFVDNLVANPTPEMLKYAVHDAEIAVFQNQTALGKLAKGAQNIPGGEIVVPFGRTPAAVATQLINYSPVGIVKTIAENIGKGRFDQRLFSQGIGRGITGTGILYLGTELYKKGMITLSNPTDAKEKRQWELEGKKANSIKIGGKWRSIAVLGPVGNVLVVGGYLQDSLQKTGSFSQALGQTAFGGAKSLTEQTFLQGLNSFTQAINDPQGYGPSLLGSLISSTVPTIFGDTAQAGDKLQRRSSATKNGIFSPLQAKVPYLRNKLEPKIDALGQPVPRQGNIIETMLDPTRPSRLREGPIVNELKRLSKAGQFATPTPFAEDSRIGISPKEKTVLQERAGRIFRDKVGALMNTDDYKNMSDETKAKTILDFSDKARIDARVEYVHEKTAGLSGKALQIKLSELKKNGVMTREVYERWQKKYQD